MKSYMFTKLFSGFLFVLVAVGMLATLVSPVAAKAPTPVPQPGCRIIPSGPDTVIGMSMQFVVETKLTGSISMDFGDGNKGFASDNGKDAYHTYYYVGKPTVMAFVRDGRAFAMCSVEITVYDNPSFTGLGGGMYPTVTPFVSPTPTAVFTPMPASQQSNSCTTSGNGISMCGTNVIVLPASAANTMPSATMGQVFQAIINWLASH